LTQAFKDRITNYGSDPDCYKGEVSFSGLGAADPVSLHFDDIVLNIKYKDHNVGASSEGALNVEDLFNYLEQVDPTKGNMFDLFYQLADQGSIDASTFWTYLDGDLRNGPSQGMDFFRYLAYTNTSLSAMTDILQNQYTDLGIAEPANFLDMLNHPRYEIHNEFSYGYTGPVKPTKYGPRVETNGYWTIEDPYNASKEIVDTLYRNIFRTSTGAIATDAPDEKELWFMLENLGVTPAWIVLYLLTHGWTKDDVFDTFEALGLGTEINNDYPVTWGIPGSGNPDPSFWGRLTAYLDVNFQVYGMTLVSLDNEPFAFDMG